MQNLRPLFFLTLFAGSLTLTNRPAAPSTTASLAAVAAETYEADPVHSSVVFRCKHLGISQFYGRFNRISAEKSNVVYDPDDPSKGIQLWFTFVSMVDLPGPAGGRVCIPNGVGRAARN